MMMMKKAEETCESNGKWKNSQKNPTISPDGKRDMGRPRKQWRKYSVQSEQETNRYDNDADADDADADDEDDDL